MVRKKIGLTLILAVLLLLLASCGKQEVSIDPALICYPGLEWNMTQEEVMDALGIDEKEILPNGTESTPQQQVFCVENWEFMGQKGTILFEFWNAAEDYFGLRQVVIFYPERIDTDALEREMVEMLGEGRLISDGKWLRWDSEKQYADYMEEGLAELKEKKPDRYDQQVKFSEGICASYATLHYHASDGTYMNLAPCEDWDESGTTVTFYSNHVPLLQYAEFGLDISE